MFIVFLKFSENKNDAGEFMAAHNEWIQRGFDEGVFLMVGSLQPAMGGSIVAYGVTLEELKRRVALDPFVVERVVSPEIIEISPNQADERLQFLID